MASKERPYLGTSLTPSVYLNLIRDPVYLRGEWRDEAACGDNQIDHEMFFGWEDDNIEVAKEVCSVCPVRVECLSYAMQHNAPDGIWGGRTTKVRKRMRRKLFKALTEMGVRFT